MATRALTVNRLCGSGFQSIVNGAHVSVYIQITYSLVEGNLAAVLQISPVAHFLHEELAHD